MEREPRAETTRRNKDNKRHTKSKTTSRKTGPARSRRGSAQSSTGSQQTGPGPRQSRKRSRQWQARKNFSFWRKARWLAARLLVIAILVTAAVTGYHWYSGAPLGAAVEMMTEDYRLAAACPTETETVFDFLRRASYPDNDSRMSVRYPDDWEVQVCSADILYGQSTEKAEGEQPTQNLKTTNMPPPMPKTPPSLRHIEEKLYMLELINDERVSAGMNPVVLGDNAAAQLHAEASLENCFSSHWGIDGLKPYMRYSLAGGFQSNGENGSGSDYCIQASDGYRANGSAEQEIRQAMEGWMDSPGHRDNILDPWHKKVNIGLAWDRYNLIAYQHFEGDYVEYDQLPNIERGVLTMSGTMKNGAQLDDDFYSGMQVYYDQPPHSLSRGQVARTYCYDNGFLVASLRQSLSGGWYYDEDEFIQTYLPCPDPYSVSAKARAAHSHDEAHSIWLSAYRESLARQPQTITVPWITAQKWAAKGEEFSIAADLSDVLAKHGEGVYSLVVWGSIGDERVIISQYSLFHDVTAPDTYDVYEGEGG